MNSPLLFLKPQPALMVFSAALVFCGCSQKIDSPQEYVEVARRHERAGQMVEAAAAYRAALKLDPDSAVTWYDLGVACAAMDQFAESIEAYSRAIELDSSLDQAFNNRGAAYARLKQFDQAISDCTRAIALNPSDEVAWRNRGLAYHDNGDLQRAIDDFDSSIRLNGMNALSYLYRGNVYLDQQRPERALEDFNSAVGIDDSLAQAWHSRAKAEIRLGKMSQAKTSGDEAEKLGADVSDLAVLQMNSAAASADTNEVRSQFVESVRQLLAEEGIVTVDAEQPWDLKTEDKEPIHYVVRAVRNTDHSPAEVEFSQEEITRFSHTQLFSTTLILVGTVPENQENASQTPTVLCRINNWTPDKSRLVPVSWLLSVPLESTGD